MLRLLLTSVLIVAGAGPSGFDDARRLRQNGRYDESLEAYDSLAKEAEAKKSAVDAARAALGRADCLASLGRIDEALAATLAASKSNPKDPAPAALRSELLFGKGDWDAARASAQAALAIDQNNLPARWIIVRLLEAAGDREQAVDACKWFVDRYNARRDELGRDPDALLLVGQASERYYRARARGDELSESLNDVINEIYEGALRVDPNCWQAAWLEGRLFLSGYNEAGARRELGRALKINPSSAEAIVTLGRADLDGYKLADGRKKAERALAINPAFAPALVLSADLNISDERFADALDASKKALAVNPRDEEALARYAASSLLLVDPLGAAWAEREALARSPRPAAFYAALAERLADRRKYAPAEHAFLQAAAAEPGRADAAIGLGMLYMQIGREEEARALFDDAFAADPFNVRADNMRKVLKHMSTYATLDSAHYSILYDPTQDTLLAKYMSRYLESIHDELTARFGYAVAGRTKIEIMKNHQWFSGRTIALPFIPTVGACTGRVVALASPLATNRPFNWARVMKHETVHVITLQQTEFNIPHWYTEALAVESEGYPRPQEWNALLLDRVPGRSKLLNLDTINLGFIRPKEADDRQMAYCQAQLYARYMLKRFGSDALIKMLNAYRRGLTTDRAVAASFGVAKADFEAGYLAYLDDVVKTIQARTSDDESVPFSRLERMLAAQPDDADLNARVAYAFFQRRDYKAARPLADKALKLKPKHPLASYVKARLLETIGDDDAARAILEPALDPKKPDARVLDRLAELVMKAGRLDDAEKLYEIGRQGDPFRTKWIAGLARVHLRQKKEDKFLDDLAQIAANDADDLSVRKALAERHLKRGDIDQAEKWAADCLHIKVDDPSLHTLYGDALAAGKKFDAATDEYQTALSLKPRKPNDILIKLAQLQIDAKKPTDAKTTLDQILKADPENPAALKLKMQLEGK